MKVARDNFVKMKSLVVVNLVMAVLVFVLVEFVIPNLFWDEHPDGDYTYEDVYSATVILLTPIALNILLPVIMIVFKYMSDKSKIFKVYVKASIWGTLVNVFQTGLVLNTAVDHFDRMSFDGGRVAQAYVLINIVLLISGLISACMMCGYVAIIKMVNNEKKSIRDGNVHRWN